MTLKVYIDLMSQPCRALIMFLRAAKVPHEEISIALRKETSAIVAYICANFNVADHWYPMTDVKKRAKIDEYLSWQQTGLRLFGSMLFRDRVLSGKKEAKQIYVDGFETAIQQLQGIFLANGKYEWINNNIDVSFADLWCVSELEQDIIAGFDIFAGKPVLEAYYKRVTQRMTPYYDDVNHFTKILKSRVTQGKL